MELALQWDFVVVSTTKLMLLATKLDASMDTEALCHVPWADAAVSFHAMLVMSKPSPCILMQVLVTGTLIFSLQSKTWAIIDHCIRLRHDRFRFRPRNWNPLWILDPFQIPPDSPVRACQDIKSDSVRIVVWNSINSWLNGGIFTSGRIHDESDATALIANLSGEDQVVGGLHYIWINGGGTCGSGVQVQVRNRSTSHSLCV